MSRKPVELETSDRCTSCGSRPLVLLTFARFDGRGFVTLCLACSPRMVEGDSEVEAAE